MRKKILLSCVPVIMFYSCTVLSKSQLKNISAFATATSTYCFFPGEVVRKSQELHYNNDILEASAIPDPAIIIRSLDQAKAEFEIGIALSKKMDLSLRLIQQYAALLGQLSSDSATDEMGENTKALCSSLDGSITLFNNEVTKKIPSTVGSTISQIVKIIGERVIKSKQAKALKKFIPAADTLIQVTSYNLVIALDGDLKPLIENYKKTFHDDYNKIVFSHPDKIDYNLLRFYVKTNSDFEVVELLRQKCISSAEKMALAHRELKNNVREKKHLGEVLKETKDFAADVKNLYQALRSLTATT
jgi:WD40 repeat protein